VFVAETPPKPVSGGTLLVLSDKRTVLLADPDRDQVLVVDVVDWKVAATVALSSGAEPGRAIKTLPATCTWSCAGRAK
jgi:hypothetical protein